MLIFTTYEQTNEQKDKNYLPSTFFFICQGYNLYPCYLPVEKCIHFNTKQEKEKQQQKTSKKQ